MTKLTFNGGKRGGIDTKRTITKTELALMGAIFPEDVARCRRRVKIGDAFTVADNSWKSEKGNGVRPVRDVHYIRADNPVPAQAWARKIYRLRG